LLPLGAFPDQALCERGQMSDKQITLYVITFLAGKASSDWDATAYSLRHAKVGDQRIQREHEQQALQHRANGDLGTNLIQIQKLHFEFESTF
jgi:hypothetical protein